MNVMTQAQLVESLKEDGYTRAQAKRALDHVCRRIMDEVTQGRDVSTPLGRFGAKWIKPKVGKCNGRDYTSSGRWRLKITPKKKADAALTGRPAPPEG